MTIKNTKTLTLKQQRVYDFLSAQIARCGESPTVVEIARFLGVSSLRTVTQYLEALERKELIFRLGRQSRGIRLVGQSPVMTVTIPVLSNAGCDNMSVFAEQVVGEYVTVDRVFLHGCSADQIFAFRAVGDSMVGAGIETGDLVLVERGAPLRQKDAVVAVVDGMAVIKQIHFSPNAVILHPVTKNPGYAPIVMRKDFPVFGKVINVIKDVPMDPGLVYETFEQ